MIDARRKELLEQPRERRRELALRDIRRAVHHAYPDRAGEIVDELDLVVADARAELAVKALEKAKAALGKLREERARLRDKVLELQYEIEDLESALYAATHTR